MLEYYADKEWPTAFEVSVIATMYITVVSDWFPSAR